MKITFISNLEVTDYDINCLAMAIVNQTNESNFVNSDQRQLTNDDNFDFAVKKIEEFLKIMKE
jgi:hypothetical protein